MRVRVRFSQLETDYRTLRLTGTDKTARSALYAASRSPRVVIAGTELRPTQAYTKYGVYILMVHSDKAGKN